MGTQVVFFTLAYGESTIKVTKILKVRKKEVQSVSFFRFGRVPSRFSAITYFFPFIPLKLYMYIYSLIIQIAIGRYRIIKHFY